MTTPHTSTTHSVDGDAAHDTPMAHDGHAAHVSADPVSGVTRGQLAAVTLLTVLALVGSYVFAASRANLSLSAHDVGGLVMPPGMIMGRETTGESMRDMAAVDLRKIAYAAPANARGDQPLQPRLDGGVKVFNLQAEAIRWRDEASRVDFRLR